MPDSNARLGMQVISGWCVGGGDWEESMDSNGCGTLRWEEIMVRCFGILWSGDGEF